MDSNQDAQAANLQVDPQMLSRKSKSGQSESLDERETDHDTSPNTQGTAANIEQDDQEVNGMLSGAWEDDEYTHPRCDFKALSAISDDQWRETVRLLCHPAIGSEDVYLMGNTNGTFNGVVYVDCILNGTTHSYLVRVPAHGTLAHWTPEDAYMLEREVELIKNIRENTSVPVPEIMGHSTGHNNVLRFPYIVRKKLPGRGAYNIWLEPGYDQSNNTLAYRTADVPSTATEKKRITFLRSLAKHMAQLDQLAFPCIGIPSFSSEGSFKESGPSYHWPTDGSDECATRLSCSSTQEYLSNAHDDKFAITLPLVLNDATYELFGQRAIFRVLSNQTVFNSTDGDTFSIRHNDLDLQNILVDDEGNVTGIIDWDCAISAPRCIRAAAAPTFLRNDWFPYYANDIHAVPHMAWNYEYYRQIYAAAMVEAGNVEGAKYTIKSAMYAAAIAAVTEGGAATDFIDKLLREIPECRRTNARDLTKGLGMGWKRAREMLEPHIAKIFEPTLPSVNLLRDLDAEMTMRSWWTEFDGALE
ncbi:hypothetical protein T440DRAFT_547710 [Plenodomus tracheiphilus IPT5]|uniref:Aminoglycoside phosphotransferase domain-containing protein n=1 Tax=Plenodomus tracheiphilus IPT5 TaxID=1408161 RepID=A0A6A7BGK5_9PLEO|nr:hypothetical protein T440DRAFT_547710 [Plenodomus tracheiphilus IPT5]